MGSPELLEEINNSDAWALQGSKSIIFLIDAIRKLTSLSLGHPELHKIELLLYAKQLPKYFFKAPPPITVVVIISVTHTRR